MRAIRNVRAEKKIKAGRRIPAVLVGGPKTQLLAEQAGIIALLAKVDPEGLQILDQQPEEPLEAISLVVGPVEIFLPVAGTVNSIEEEQRLRQELAEIQTQVTRLETLLSSPFAEKAPPAVIQKEHDRTRWIPG